MTEMQASDEERNDVVLSFLPQARKIAWRFARKYGLNAGDCIQEGALGLMAAASRQGRALTKSYANAAIRNALIRFVNGEATDVPVISINEAIGVETSNPETEFLIEEVQRARRMLPTQWQKVLMLRFEEDLTVRQTAHVLKISKSEVARIETAAIGELREKFGTKSEIVTLCGCTQAKASAPTDRLAA